MQSDWTELDNAAKIFPPTIDKRDTKVFRFSCELTEPVEQSVLQKALTKTLKYFPFYRSILKRGLFWYYLEISALEPVVAEEHTPPCSPLYDKAHRSLLFDVSFYKRRINLEVFHALSDGSGALQFFKMLVYQYVKLKYRPASLQPLDYDASFIQKIEDSFEKNYVPGKSFHQKSMKAYQLRGVYLPEGRLGIILGNMSVKAVLARAKAYDTTITIYLAAILLQAIHSEMAQRYKNRPVSIMVPVNLRNYFESETARNFFGVIYVSYHFGQCSGEFTDIIDSLKRQFTQKLTAEQLGMRIHNLMSWERNIFARLLPLPVKNMVLRAVNMVNKRESTCALSNLGIIHMPEAVMRYIQSFQIISSTGRLQLCLVSYEDVLSIGFTSAFASSEIQKRFFRFLTKEGIKIEIATNSAEDDEDDD